MGHVSDKFVETRKTHNVGSLFFSPKIVFV